MNEEYRRQRNSYVFISPPASPPKIRKQNTYVTRLDNVVNMPRMSIKVREQLYGSLVKAIG